MSNWNKVFDTRSHLLYNTSGRRLFGFILELINDSMNSVLTLATIFFLIIGSLNLLAQERADIISLPIGSLALVQKHAKRIKAPLKSLEGTLVDAKCFLAEPAMNKGNNHAGVKRCGTLCAKSGNPVGIVDKKGRYHTILISAVPLADYVGEEVRVIGTVDGKSKTITPDKIEIKKEGRWDEVKIVPAT